MPMLLKSLTPAALALGFMLSPESLAKLGNSVGQGGAGFLVLFALTAVVQVANATSYSRVSRFLSGSTLESHPLEAVTGPWLARLIPLVTRTPAFLSLGTAVLATAGFVFNEVFVYWFPNFAFAFLLLVLLAVLNLASPRVAFLAQSLFAVAAVAGLLVLSIAALISWSTASARVTMEVRTVGPHLAGVALSLLAGFELSYHSPPAAFPRSAGGLPSRSVVMFCSCLFLIWGFVSLILAPTEKLAESSVPHMLVARLGWGETGRSLMGAVVLAGCAGVVNGSYLALPSLLSHGDPVGLSVDGRSRIGWTGRIGVVLLTAALAIALGTGMAGEPLLDTWIRGALLLWLLGYSGFQGALCALSLGRSFRARSHSAPERFRATIHALLSLFFLVVVAASIWTDPERKALLVFMLLAPAAIGLILLPWCRSAVGYSRGG